MSIWIRNGTVINCDQMRKSDVIIRDGIIAEVGRNLRKPTDLERIIDAKGLYVMPGGIDPHTHLEVEFMRQLTVDDFYTGSQAAVAGGTTMFIDFIWPRKEESLIEAYKLWRRKADGKVCCDYGLSSVIVNFNDQTDKEMETLVKLEFGINSFKVFMAYTDYMMNDGDLYHVMRRCAEIGALARIHAENGYLICRKQKELLSRGVTGPEGHPQSRPEEIEEEATNRACVLATQANCPLYVVHVMSKGAAQVVAEHRRRGAVIFGEPTAAGLGVDGTHYYDKDWRHAAMYVMSPPLSKDPTAKDLLMDYLAGGQLQLVGTDNCTFTSEQKEQGRDNFTKIPNGVNGLEDRMSVVWEKGVHTGKLDPMRFVEVTSSMAAKIFNIYPRKGRITFGADADIIVWNPYKTRVISADTHHHACDTNIFEGMEVHGVCEVTISRGKIVWENGELKTERGAGRFVPLPPFSPHCFATIPYRAEMMSPRRVKRDRNPVPSTSRRLPSGRRKPAEG